MIPFQLYGGQSPELHQLLQRGWGGGGENWDVIRQCMIVGVVHQ